MSATDTHECPIVGCAKAVQSHHLMCGHHWRLVSTNLQSRLYRAWANGFGQGTDAHAEAMRQCIEEVEWKLMEGARLRANADERGRAR